MAEELSIDKESTAILSMDWQMRQLSLFPEAFQNEIILTIV